jgi:hypothetical protein
MLKVQLLFTNCGSHFGKRTYLGYLWMYSYSRELLFYQYKSGCSKHFIYSVCIITVVTGSEYINGNKIIIVTSTIGRATRLSTFYSTVPVHSDFFFIFFFFFALQVLDDHVPRKPVYFNCEGFSLCSDDPTILKFF